METSADKPPTADITVLDVDACWTLLRANEVGRLAVAITNHPDVFPVNYVVDDDTIVFRTAEGTKLAAAVLGTAVAFEIDGFDSASGDAWSVVLKGSAEEIEVAYGLFDIYAFPLVSWNATPKHRFVRITPVETTGRRFAVTDMAAWHQSVPVTQAVSFVRSIT